MKSQSPDFPSPPRQLLNLLFPIVKELLQTIPVSSAMLVNNHTLRLVMKKPFQFCFPNVLSGIRGGADPETVVRIEEDEIARFGGKLGTFKPRQSVFLRFGDLFSKKDSGVS
jgi:hypothetical protein